MSCARRGRDVEPSSTAGHHRLGYRQAKARAFGGAHLTKARQRQRHLVGAQTAPIIADHDPRLPPCDIERDGDQAKACTAMAQRIVDQVGHCLAQHQPVGFGQHRAGWQVRQQIDILRQCAGSEIMADLAQDADQINLFQWPARCTCALERQKLVGQIAHLPRRRQKFARARTGSLGRGGTMRGLGHGQNARDGIAQLVGGVRDKARLRLHRRLDLTKERVEP